MVLKALQLTKDCGRLKLLFLPFPFDSEFPGIVVKLEEEEQQDSPRVKERTSIAADHSGEVAVHVPALA